jgi:L,D-transpeptidase catalytic domain
MPYRGRAGRRGLRVAVGAVVVLVAGVVLAGVGTAAPLFAGTPVAAAESLLGPPEAAPGQVAPAQVAPEKVAADPDGFARDQGVPVPDVPPCLPTVRACVELATDQAWLLESGRVVRGPVPITPGDEENPTPRGSFAVQWKAPAYTSREFLVQMPWSVFFADGGIAFHEGDPETYSAGCIKLAEEDARAFFTYLQVGDSVQVV